MSIEPSSGNADTTGGGSPEDPNQMDWHNDPDEQAQAEPDPEAAEPAAED